jgi:hypothetical protein
VRAVETLTLLLAATVLFMWAILAHPTPEERARLHDSMGPSTALHGDNSDRERRVARLTQMPL